MSKDDNVYLRHILEAITKIEKYTKSVSHKDFVADSLVQDGVVRQIEIIGEATKRLSIKINCSK